MRCLLSENTDISPLYHFKHLEKMIWCENSVALELAKFPALHEFYFDAIQHNIDFKNNKIKILGADHILDLLFLKDFPSVEELTLRVYLGSNLQGIEQLTKLNNLTIHSAKKITDIQHISQCFNLATFEFESFNKNLDLSPLSTTNLCGLYLHNAIKTCSFVEQMQCLTNITIKEILDDDLLPLLNSKTLDYAYLYKHKKSYNCSKKVFQERFPSQA